MISSNKPIIKTFFKYCKNICIIGGGVMVISQSGESSMFITMLNMFNFGSEYLDNIYLSFYRPT